MPPAIKPLTKLGAAIRNARQAAGLSVNQLSASIRRRTKTQCPAALLYRWESGASQPSDDTLTAIGEILGTNFETLKGK